MSPLDVVYVNVKHLRLLSKIKIGTLDDGPTCPKRGTYYRTCMFFVFRRLAKDLSEYHYVYIDIDLGQNFIINDPWPVIPQIYKSFSNLVITKPSNFGAPHFDQFT